MTTNLIGQQAPLLHIAEWVQGTATNLDQLPGKVILIEVFQVNCPGCFLYSLPQAIDLYDKYHDKGLEVIALATAFEDFDKNTLSSLQLLIDQHKVIGETYRVFEKNQQLIDGALPYRIPFPVAMDVINKSQSELNEGNVNSLIEQYVPDFKKLNNNDQQQIRKQAINLLQSSMYKAETFNLYKLQGTPSHIVIDKQGNLTACKFGYYNELESLITRLLPG